ncbi:MAG: hypothetical protein KGL18_00220 [Burkholderiales bacterium]|nr:alkaline phosphatase family protein [Burkholderiales bacterium]MDE1926585.1 hypothetical protein [Burkholderiales bacterium]MDE2159042.1 hypothetical protein [Burkholderiales bacterium]MDE2501386.1 hypothetical protein [Burkholderiales bacterium]
MKLHSIAAAIALAAGCAAPALAGEGQTPQGVHRLDHVWVIVMENHGYGQVVGNPNAPFINQMARTVNVATNYYGVGHPSLTNYLEIVGGSNFGVQNDNSPDWHNAGCTPAIVSGVPVNEANPAAICPIWGQGVDAATPAIDYTNEVTGTPGNPATGAWNIDGSLSVAAATTVGKTIADQLDAAHSSWKSYQEDLPLAGADGVNASDGVFVNANDLSVLSNPQPASSNVVALYAVKHNPFAYFKSVQENGGLKKMAGFDGDHGLYADLRSGHVPAYSLIAPNQCNDQHGRSGAGVYCAYDPNDNGTQNGLNPGLIYRGDVAVQKIVGAIEGSPVWRHGHNAIVVVWDENDYAVATPNKVLTLVETNDREGRVVSNQYYNHYSLLKTIESGLGLPCLNHACDASVAVMSDLFGR